MNNFDKIAESVKDAKRFDEYIIRNLEEYTQKGIKNIASYLAKEIKKVDGKEYPVGIEKEILIIDMIGKLRTNGKYPDRLMTAIEQVVIHQTWGKAYRLRSNTKAVNEYHINEYNWAGIAYHLVIDLDSSGVELCNALDTITNGAGGNNNKKSIHILVCGKFDYIDKNGSLVIGGQAPTLDQLGRLKQTIEYIISRSDIPNVKGWEDIKGHIDITGKRSCPGIVVMENLKRWRKE
ncbi:MAG: N-acetylmuramoyl-L-alanine amidase [Desulfobacterales bacterium]|nr:N-acetylmuramoyl-L-alanine amidase [Desulfobacterales bacterium]